MGVPIPTASFEVSGPGIAKRVLFSLGELDDRKALCLGQAGSGEGCVSFADWDGALGHLNALWEARFDAPTFQANLARRGGM